MSKPNKANQLLSVGFIFLLTGTGLAILAGHNRALQMVSLLLIVIASALFGASISVQRKNREN